MKVLYIDTSSSYLYAGIVSAKKTVCEIKKEFGQNLSEEALPSIVNLFEKSNLSAKDIDKIIVVNGPGSFTGIRIGITIAKVYAWTLNIPITTISSLEAMAISSISNKNHIPIIDARRGFVYSAIYDKNNKEILSPKHIKLEKLIEEVEKVSDSVYISNDEFENLINIEKYNPNIEKIVNYFDDKDAVSAHSVNPEYLKLTEAEENKKNHD